MLQPLLAPPFYIHCAVGCAVHLHGGLLQGEDNTHSWSSVPVKHKMPSTTGVATGVRHGLAWQSDETPKAYQVQRLSNWSNNFDSCDAVRLRLSAHMLCPCMQHLRCNPTARVLRCCWLAPAKKHFTVHFADQTCA